MVTRLIDLTGKRFGKLTVVGKSLERKRDVLPWDCVCDCGKTKVVAGQELRNGQTKSCGCSAYKGTPKDITGKQKGSLTAIESTGNKSGNGDYIWKFLCTCGNFCERTIGNFNSKAGKQFCGSCALKDKIERIEARKKHGFPKNHKTYKTWCKIKERCFGTNI